MFFQRFSPSTADDQLFHPQNPTKNREIRFIGMIFDPRILLF